ncbi:hypothetical protein A2U01_0056881, partial [Trifolium medium]|nr:hypothetical protein [Trifolium medium]
MKEGRHDEDMEVEIPMSTTVGERVKEKEDTIERSYRDMILRRRGGQGEDEGEEDGEKE